MRTCYTRSLRQHSVLYSIGEPSGKVTRTNLRTQWLDCTIHVECHVGNLQGKITTRRMSAGQTLGMYARGHNR